MAVLSFISSNIPAALQTIRLQDTGVACNAQLPRQALDHFCALDSACQKMMNCPGNLDMAVLQGLAENLQHLLWELGQFVQKEHPVVGQ